MPDGCWPDSSRKMKKKEKCFQAFLRTPTFLVVFPSRFSLILISENSQVATRERNASLNFWRDFDFRDRDRGFRKDFELEVFCEDWKEKFVVAQVATLRVKRYFAALEVVNTFHMYACVCVSALQCSGNAVSEEKWTRLQRTTCDPLISYFVFWVIREVFVDLRIFFLIIWIILINPKIRVYKFRWFINL